MNDETQDAALRVRAAIAAAQYEHAKPGEGGKKEAQQAAAEDAAQRKFAPPAPPKLIVSNA
jgi:phage terminase small subunit